MSGIMATAVGIIAAQNIIYGSGLYGPDGVDLSPVSRSESNVFTITRTWIGYYRAPSTGSIQFGVQALWNSDDSFEGQYSRGYVWVGNVAKSGYTTSNALASADNSFGTGNISLVSGLYYPIRMQWDAYLPTSGGFFGYDTDGSITLYVNSSTNVSGAIFYNTLTNGF